LSSSSADSDTTGSAQALVTGLRSLLRFLFAAHYISHQLSGAVLAPSGFAGGSLPHILDDDMIEALLASCERRNACGRRDFRDADGARTSLPSSR